MVASLYRGFSSVGVKSVDTRAFNANLVKRDLLNHFETKLGDRRGRPDFGSIIHDLLFDIMDPRTENLVIADAQRILSEDPRVEPLEVGVSLDIDRNSITLNISLLLVEFNMVENFRVIFEERG